MNESHPQAPWYIVTVGPAAEKAVAHEFTERKLEVFLPTETIWRTLGRKTKYERPLIRGYVIVQTANLPGLFEILHDMGDKARVFRSAEGVPHVVRPDWVHVVSAAWLAGDFDQTVPRDKKGRIKRAFEEGDPIRVVSGPYFGYAGQIKRLGRGRGKVTISICNAIGHEYSGDIDLAKLEAA